MFLIENFKIVKAKFIYLFILAFFADTVNNIEISKNSTGTQKISYKSSLNSNLINKRLIVLISNQSSRVLKNLKYKF